MQYRPASLRHLPAWLLAGPFIVLIKIYQYGISPLLGPRCRFWPSCSQYTLEAIQLHGPLKGSWLGFKRILKCHPLHPGGIDPVPPARCSCRDEPNR